MKHLMLLLSIKIRKKITLIIRELDYMRLIMGQNLLIINLRPI